MTETLRQQLFEELGWQGDASKVRDDQLLLLALDRIVKDRATLLKVGRNVAEFEAFLAKLESNWLQQNQQFSRRMFATFSIQN